MRIKMAPSPRAKAPYFAWLSILTGGAWTPSFYSHQNKGFTYILIIRSLD
jgi:hypothetical protein